MADPTILITGATGTVSGEVARALAADGVPFRALVRDRSRADGLPGAELVVGDYTDPDSLAAAFEGVDRLFLVAPLTPRLAELEGHAVDAAEQAGVRHVVKLSTAGVTQGDGGPRQYPLHRGSEEHLERSGLAYTHLRPGPFFQNTLNFAPSIAAEGVFRGAWGEGTLGYVDVRDVAQVAARVLTGDGHEGQAYELTGPEPLAPADIARELSAATGREVRYVDVPPEGVRQAMASRGMPEWLAGAMAEVQEHTRHGGAGRVTDDVARITGRPPRSYADFAREFADRFAGG